jgi:hypothetical protein
VGWREKEAEEKNPGEAVVEPGGFEPRWGGEKRWQRSATSEGSREKETEEKNPGGGVVEPGGFEPPTFAMRTRRSPE